MSYPKEVGRWPAWCVSEEEARALELLEGSTVLLVEDIGSVRRALARFLRAAMRLLEARSVAEAVTVGRSALPGLDLAIVDLGLPDGSGWEVIAELWARDPALRFMVVSALEDTSPPDDLPDALLDRVVFVDKPTTAKEILAVAAYSYHLVQQDRAASTISSPLPSPHVARRPRTHGLALRESQAMRGCSLGLTNEEIAEQLGIAVGTLKKHVSAGLEKLKVASRHQVRDKLELGRKDTDHE